MVNQDVKDAATTNLPNRNPIASSKKPRRNYQRHGFTPLLRGRYTADTRQIDGRSALAQAMAEYRNDLLHSLGGKENLSTQELTLVEMCAKDWLILQTVDAYLLQNGLINRRKRTAYPLTVQRMQIADSLAKRLQALGIGRRSKPVKSLQDLLRTNDQPAP